MADLPNAQRLQQLPLRALVAYAVRNAMRVQLLYLKWRDDQAQAGPQQGMVEAVAEAIALASRFASQEAEYDLKRGQELEETVIEAVMRASQSKGGHRGAAFAANAAYAALNAANVAAGVSQASNRREEGQKVVLAAITAADAASAAHEPVIQSAIDDWHTMNLMRFGQFPELGRPVDPSPEGKLGPLFNQKPKAKSWKDKSPALNQIKKTENVLEQTRSELVIQQQERKKDKAAHEAQCDEYEKTIRHLKAEVIPLKRERDDLTKQVKGLQSELEALQEKLAQQAEAHRTRLTDFANQLLSYAAPVSEPDLEPEPTPDPQAKPVVEPDSDIKEEEATPSEESAEENLEAVEC